MANLEDIAQMVVVDAIEAAEIAVERPPRRFLAREDPFQCLNDRMFIKMFRLTKELVRELLVVLDGFLVEPSRESALSKELKVLLALKFYAGGSYRSDVGYNLFLGVSQSSACRAIEEVTNALNQPQVMNVWVKFPRTVAELENIRRRSVKCLKKIPMYMSYGIPGVIGGCIDCTHVAIRAPNVNDADYPEHIYVNTKNCHSINVQLICDSNMKILNVNARFPGSIHDVHIWNQSAIQNTMRRINTVHPDFFLIGDSGYPLRAWLQTPIRNPLPGTPEERYNSSFLSARSTIERCNGLLKVRFRCLLKHRVLHYSPTKASKIVNACVILHNMCIEHNVPEPAGDEDNENIDFGIYHQNIPNGEDIGRNEELAAGRALQRRLVNNFQ